MVLEREVYPYLQWLLTGGPNDHMGALVRFLAVGAVLATLGLLVGFVISLLRHQQAGVLRAGDRVYQTTVRGIGDLLSTSPRRVLAMAGLAVKEAWRRRIVVALAVFFVILLFANWFLSVNHARPARLYMSFVLTATTYLVLLIALLLSAFSLPNDFKSKTIFTVVTKPVRAGEIVLGRILGFAFVGTVLLAIMAALSYVFVSRSLGHTHQADADTMRKIETQSGEFEGWRGDTTLQSDHRHLIEIGPDGYGRAVMHNGHYHEAIADDDGKIEIGPAEGFLRARVPRYAESLRFIDRSGQEDNRGISVGNEWTYRSFIGADPLEAAIWKFNGVSKSQLIEVLDGDATVEALPMAMIVRVFKTHKGTIGEQIPGSVQLRNPKTGVASDPRPFLADDAQVQDVNFTVAQIDKTGQPIDLFDDLVSDEGELEIVVRCEAGQQYFGFAKADLYIRQPDGSPIVNFAKVYVGIWVQMVIVISVGVAISTIVSGPVAMLFTAAFVLLGFFRDFFVSVAEGGSYGGGPGESLYRMGTQANVMSKLDDNWLATILQGFDWYIAKPFMWCIAQVLPDFSQLDSVMYAADGYAVPWDRVYQDLTLCAAYVIGLSILGYFLLKTREVAR